MCSKESCYASTPQFMSRRYMAPLLQPASRGATYGKLTSKVSLCNGLSAFAMRFSFCLSPASNGRDVPRVPVPLTSWLQIAKHDNSHVSVRLMRAGSRIFGGGLIELAVER